MFCKRHFIRTLLILLSLRPVFAESIPVKHVEGAFHAFLLMRSEDGKPVAVGDFDQTVKGQQLNGHLKFRFNDGSIYEETTVFTQRGVFRVLSDHLLQTGPSFKNPIEVWIDSASNQVKVRDTKDGKNNITTNHLAIPADLVNGILPTIVKDFSGAQHTVSMLVATPKPRIVKLVITPQNEDSFLIEGTKYQATQYVAKVEIGGVSGAVAPIVGKQPPDSHLWVLNAAVPIFLRSTGPICSDNVVWQIELVSPSWPDLKN